MTRRKTHVRVPKGGLHLPLATGFPTTHEQLEVAHNRLEHARNEHGGAYESTRKEDTYEPLNDYDLDVMPRGV